MIPPNITNEHIVRAIKEIDNGRVIPQSRESHGYLLKFNGKIYPPKFTISLANKYANGTELQPDDFHGGDETNNFLKSRSFEIIPYNPTISEGWVDFKQICAHFATSYHSELAFF